MSSRSESIFPQPAPARLPVLAVRRSAAPRLAAAGHRRRLWRRVRTLLARALRGPLTLEIDGKRLRFDCPGDLDFALESRAQCPVRAVLALLARPAAELRDLAASVARTERRLAALQARVAAGAETFPGPLADVDPELFTEDHGWREVMVALGRAGVAYEDYRQAALARYLEYLRARRQALASLRRPPGAAPRAAPPAAAFAETGVFDIDAAPSSSPAALRLPRGEGVDVRLQAGQSLAIRLARHAFTLVAGEHLYLVDEHGRCAILGTRSLVGRGADCDVVLDPAFRSVSRAHLAVESAGTGAIRLTDLSSLGTWIPHAAVA